MTKHKGQISALIHTNWWQNDWWSLKMSGITTVTGWLHSETERMGQDTDPLCKLRKPQYMCRSRIRWLWLSWDQKFRKKPKCQKREMVIVNKAVCIILTLDELMMTRRKLVCSLFIIFVMQLNESGIFTVESDHQKVNLLINVKVISTPEPLKFSNSFAFVLTGSSSQCFHRQTLNYLQEIGNGWFGKVNLQTSYVPS